MRSRLVSSIRGYVQVEIRGKYIEAFINHALEQRYTLWDIRRTDKQSATLHLHLKDFFRLRPLLRQTSCRVRVLRRLGLPFMLDKLERRKFFAAGMIAFFIGIYLLSSIIWHVEVEGNERIPTEDILIAAKKHGMYAKQWKFRLQDPDLLSKAMMRDVPGTSWIGIAMEGTRLRIKVVESVIPIKKPLSSPRHLVADSDAVVTDLYAETGRPLVRPNSRVKKGDILISGIIGDTENQQSVVAKGFVKGFVWHEYDIEVPLLQRMKVYTGLTKKRFHLVLGNRALQLTGYGKPHFSKSESESRRKTLQWRNVAIPIGWVHEKVLEVELEERQRSPEEAKAVGIQQARADILLRSGTSASVAGENILHEKIESGKVYMKVLFEVEEEISEEKPIVQGD